MTDSQGIPGPSDGAVALDLATLARYQLALYRRVQRLENKMRTLAGAIQFCAEPTEGREDEDGGDE